MKRKTIIRIIITISCISVLLFAVAILFVQPWADKKIRSALSEQKSAYLIDVEDIHVSLFRREVKLDNIRISPRDSIVNGDGLSGKINSISCSGMHLFKILFHDDLLINQIRITGTELNGEIPFKNDSVKPIILPMDILVDKLFFDKLSFSIQDTLTPQRFIMQKGEIKISGLEMKKYDTLSIRIFHAVDLSIPYFAEITSDSMYTFSVNDLHYDSDAKLLSMDSFVSHPNYENYDFTDKRAHVTSRMDAVVSNIYMHDFSLAECIQTGNLKASYIELGQIDAAIFKDARKTPNRQKRPMLQEMMYDYPAVLKVDSLFILDGEIVYEEHGAQSNQPGKVRFEDVQMQAYCITNDSVSANDTSMFEIIAKTFIMGKSEFRMHMKAELFDPENRFTFKGSASAMHAEDLNPIVEKNAYVFVNSGTVDNMYFNFSANNFNSTGTMVFLYHDLNLTLKNKNTDDTTAMKERLLTILANMKVKDANPQPGQGIRTGEIYFERNTEKYMINYCFKSILSGILSSISNTKKKEESK